MASVLDICNLALSRLGDDATVSSINPPEGSVQAENCARFYPLSRDTLLSMHDWGFATTTEQLALKANVYKGLWKHAYAMPNKCIKAIKVTEDETDRSFDYVLGSAPDGSEILLTNAEQAILLYLKKIEDPSRYPALVIDAIAWLLASNLAGPLIKGDSGAQMSQRAYEAYLGALQRAIAFDVQQHSPKKIEVKTPWVVDR